VMRKRGWAKQNTIDSDFSTKTKGVLPWRIDHLKQLLSSLFNGIQPSMMENSLRCHNKIETNFPFWTSKTFRNPPLLILRDFWDYWNSENFLWLVIHDIDHIRVCICE
jgi:hypothetical protein